MKKKLLLFVFCLLGTLCAGAQTDYTSYITNPSFEDDVTSGWTNNGMWRQTNNVFTGKVGSYYLESWVSTANQLGSCGVSQTIASLPAGNYQLKVNAQHINENSPTAAQSGVYLFAGTARQTVTTNNTYTLSFSMLETGSVEIGLVGEGATGNYLCVDNFQLSYVSAVNADSYKTEIRNLISTGEGLVGRVQSSVSSTLSSAISAGNNALSSSNTTTLQNAYNNLVSAVAAAEASRALYDKLQARIDYAEKVLGWWDGVAYRATNWSTLQTAVNTAKTQVTNYNLTDAQINSAVTTLNTRISAVDKAIYCSGNACGSDADLQNSSSWWSYERSIQSKHWILFWESGYGTTVPAAVPGILERADQLFEYYAGDLGFLTINQGTSKTDTYKMIIRLRYTTDWEASGSGIDNVIGMLTLSNGAHTSRSGQTVAHEVGHCFQYQTHCDNGDWNGWMYNWGNSTLNVFWEMCAQWQAYKFYPNMQFVWDSNQGNDWFGGTINGLHRHPLNVDLRYNNYFIQDYMCHKQDDMKFIGRLWNESQSPEDPLQAYMRLTMTGTTAQKLSKLNDEMWEYGARMTTFDLDPIRSAGAWRIGFRDQTALTQDGDYWWPTQANCIENFGNNAIRINAPSTAKTLYVEFEGKAGATGYNSYNTQYAGWRIGFVAYKNDGTRIYSDITAATASSPNKTIAFDCPAGCSYVWLVVSGAPTSYWTRDWLSWSEESDVEQWPYRVKFYQTNVYGQTNNNTYPANVDPEEEHSDKDASVGNTYYDITDAMAPYLSTASMQEWTNNGFAVNTNAGQEDTYGDASTSWPFMERWANNAALPNTSIQQTIRELPNGTYYIGGSFIASWQADESVTATGVTFWAGDQSIAVATGNHMPERYALRVNVTDGTLTYGVRTESTNANWVAFDNFFLYWAGTEDEYYANATVSTPVRVVLKNPRMEEGSSNFFPGWTLANNTTSGYGVWNINDAAYANFTGKFMEAWTPSTGTLADKSALQNVTLREGNYKLQAAVNAVRQEQSITVSGVTFNFGTESVACHTGNGAPEVYTINTEVAAGTYELGLKLQSTDANWIAWDNLILYYYGADDPYHKALELCQEAAANNESGTAGAAQAALAQFEWTDAEYATKTSAEITKAIEVLTNAATISDASQQATSLIKNVDFSGSTNNGNIQGSGGRVNYPADWTFTYTYEGWNDTFVDGTNHLFNAWAGGITRAELSQTLNNLPNGVYRLSADVRVDNEAPNSSTALYGYGNGGNVARSQEAGSEISGSTTDFANYSCAFEVTDNNLTIGIRSDYSFYQIKNITLEFISGTPAEQETDASYLRQDYYWNSRTADEVDFTTAEAVAKYGQANGVRLYPKFPNQIIYANTGTQFVSDQVNVVTGGTCNNLVITDGEHLAITKSFTATSATYSRAMRETTKWGTLCLPYPLTSDSSIQYYTLNSVSIESDDEGWMNFTPVNTVSANTPVVFRKLTEGATSITAGGTSLSVSPTADTPATSGGWTLSGTYAQTAFDADALSGGNTYYIAQDQFWLATSTLSIPAFRGYFVAPASSGVKSLRISIDEGEVTGIEDIDEVQSTMYNVQSTKYNEVFDIQGRRVTHPSKGIYIIGGKKVLIK